MNWKKVVMRYAAVVLFACLLTVLGYFLAWYGAEKSEYTGQLNGSLIVGIILLWPLELWIQLRSFIFPHLGIKFSFLTLGMSQLVGYCLLSFIVTKVYQFRKRAKKPTIMEKGDNGSL